MLHKVERPMRNTSNGLFKIRCSCGWFTIQDSLEEVEKRAAVHDREWIQVEPKITKQQKAAKDKALADLSDLVGFDVTDDDARP